MSQMKEAAEMRRLGVETPIGVVTLIGTKTQLFRVELPRDTEPIAHEVPLLQAGEKYSALMNAEAWLRRYFAGEQVSWDEKAIPDAPAFHRKVYTALCRVPAGSVVSYQELADMAGSPKAARAVGQAMAKNPLSIFVPCHRVIGSNGGLHGYGGGLAMKRALLQHEGAKLK